MRNATEIEPTERMVIGCTCGEVLILLGSREDWLSEERDSFECGACGSLVLLPHPGTSQQAEPTLAGPEEADFEDVEPWISPSTGSGDHSARKLIQELRAANGG